jgi:hypothetical protein
MIRYILLSLLAISLNAEIIYKSVTLTAQGNTEQEAIQNGKKEAISRVFGEFLVSSESLNNGSFDEKIKSTLAGFVPTYQIINSNKDGKIYNLKLQIDVTNKISDDILKEMNRLKLFEDLKFANYKVCVIPSEFNTKTKAITDRINSFLIDKGFKVFGYDELAQLNRANKLSRFDLIREGANAIFKIEYNESEVSRASSSPLHRSSIKNSLVDISTGRLYSVQKASKDSYTKIDNSIITDVSLLSAIQVLKQLATSKPKNYAEFRFENLNREKIYDVEDIFDTNNIAYNQIYKDSNITKYIVEYPTAKSLRKLNRKICRKVNVDYEQQGNIYTYK